MFEKTIEKLVLKQLPGIEARLHAALNKSVEEAVKSLETRFTTGLQLLERNLTAGIKTLDERLSAEIEGYNKLAVTVGEIKSTVDALPDAGDILTDDNLDDVLSNHDVVTSDNDYIKQDDFDPSEYDLVTKDELPDVDDIKSEITSAIVEKLKEALDGVSA